MSVIASRAKVKKSKFGVGGLSVKKLAIIFFIFSIAASSPLLGSISIKTAKFAAPSSSKSTALVSAPAISCASSNLSYSTTSSSSSNKKEKFALHSDNITLPKPIKSIDVSTIQKKPTSVQSQSATKKITKAHTEVQRIEELKREIRQKIAQINRNLVYEEYETFGEIADEYARLTAELKSLEQINKKIAADFFAEVKRIEKRVNKIQELVNAIESGRAQVSQKLAVLQVDPAFLQADIDIIVDNMGELFGLCPALSRQYRESMEKIFEKLQIYKKEYAMKDELAIKEINENIRKLFSDLDNLVEDIEIIQQKFDSFQKAIKKLADLNPNYAKEYEQLLKDLEIKIAIYKKALAIKNVIDRAMPILLENLNQVPIDINLIDANFDHIKDSLQELAQLNPNYAKEYEQILNDLEKKIQVIHISLYIDARLSQIATDLKNNKIDTNTIMHNFDIVKHSIERLAELNPTAAEEYEQILLKLEIKVKVQLIKNSIDERLVVFIDCLKKIKSDPQRLAKYFEGIMLAIKDLNELNPKDAKEYIQKQAILETEFDKYKQAHKLKLEKKQKLLIDTKIAFLNVLLEKSKIDLKEIELQYNKLIEYRDKNNITQLNLKHKIADVEQKIINILKIETLFEAIEKLLNNPQWEIVFASLNQLQNQIKELTKIMPAKAGQYEKKYETYHKIFKAKLAAPSAAAAWLAQHENTENALTKPEKNQIIELLHLQNKLQVAYKEKQRSHIGTYESQVQNFQKQVNDRTKEAILKIAQNAPGKKPKETDTSYSDRIIQYNNGFIEAIAKNLKIEAELEHRAQLIKMSIDERLPYLIECLKKFNSKPENIKRYFKGIVAAIRDLLEINPHWAKEYEQIVSELEKEIPQYEKVYPIISKIEKLFEQINQLIDITDSELHIYNLIDQLRAQIERLQNLKPEMAQQYREKFEKLLNVKKEIIGNKFILEIKKLFKKIENLKDVPDPDVDISTLMYQLNDRIEELKEKAPVNAQSYQQKFESLSNLFEKEKVRALIKSIDAIIVRLDDRLKDININQLTKDFELEDELEYLDRKKEELLELAKQLNEINLEVAKEYQSKIDAILSKINNILKTTRNCLTKHENNHANATHDDSLLKESQTLEEIINKLLDSIEPNIEQINDLFNKLQAIKSQLLIPTNKFYLHEKINQLVLKKGRMFIKKIEKNLSRIKELIPQQIISKEEIEKLKKIINSDVQSLIALNKNLPHGDFNAEIMQIINAISKLLLPEVRKHFNTIKNDNRITCEHPDFIRPIKLMMQLNKVIQFACPETKKNNYVLLQEMVPWAIELLQKEIDPDMQIILKAVHANEDCSVLIKKVFPKIKALISLHKSLNVKEECLIIPSLQKDINLEIQKIHEAINADRDCSELIKTVLPKIKTIIALKIALNLKIKLNINELDLVDQLREIGVHIRQKIQSYTSDVEQNIPQIHTLKNWLSLIKSHQALNQIIKEFTDQADQEEFVAQALTDFTRICFLLINRIVIKMNTVDSPVILLESNPILVLKALEKSFQNWAKECLDIIALFEQDLNIQAINCFELVANIKKLMEDGIIRHKILEYIDEFSRVFANENEIEELRELLSLINSTLQNMCQSFTKIGILKECYYKF